MKPICIPCSRFYRCEKNGYYFLEGMPGPVESGKGDGDIDRCRSAVPGLSEAEHWRPDKLWVGNLWKCPGCDHKIISGVGAQPVSEHFHSDFAALAKVAVFQVNDC